MTQLVGSPRNVVGPKLGLRAFCHSTAWKSNNPVTRRPYSFLPPIPRHQPTSNTQFAGSARHPISSTQNGPPSRTLLPVLQEQGALRLRLFVPKEDFVCGKLGCGGMNTCAPLSPVLSNSLWWHCWSPDRFPSHRVFHQILLFLCLLDLGFPYGNLFHDEMRNLGIQYRHIY